MRKMWPLRPFSHSSNNTPSIQNGPCECEPSLSDSLKLPRSLSFSPSLLLPIWTDLCHVHHNPSPSPISLSLLSSLFRFSFIYPAYCPTDNMLESLFAEAVYSEPFTNLFIYKIPVLRTSQPLDLLRSIIDFLASLSHHPRNAGHPNLFIAVVETLLETWSSQEFISKSTDRQHLYLTAGSSSSPPSSLPHFSALSLLPSSSLSHDYSLLTNEASFIVYQNLIARPFTLS